MNQVEEVLSVIRSRGKKLTKTRSALLEIIYGNEKPISAPQILESLHARELDVNKTTVYREIAFLLEEGFINEVKISSYVTHYEPSELAHHHHLVCEDCGEVEEIVCEELEEPMGEFEKRILRSGFAIKKHNLEFYGRCSSCK